MTKLKIEYVPTAELKPRAGNPRTHTAKQIEQIVQSIWRFGFNNPILIDSEGMIIAGHGRLAAAVQLGMTEVPTVRLSDMSEADIRAYVIADNRLAELSGWDSKLLAKEFAYFDSLDIDFDLTVTGFDQAEIDVLIQSVDIDSDPLDASDTIVEPEAGEPVTRPGDVWVMGNQRIICGDALKAETYVPLMKGEKATMVFADAPYNVKISGHVSGLGKHQHREFAMASGEMSEDQFRKFLFETFTQLTAFSTEGSIHFQCMDWSHAHDMLIAGKAAYIELKNICVWTKTNGGMGALYRSAHELVFVFKAGRAPHINNVQLGKNGRYRTNHWSYPGANSFGATRDADLADHPTVKPVAMIMDAILDCSHRGDPVLDPFAGSGTTLLAAHKTGRRGFGIEIDPHYCDVIVRRMRERTGLVAVLEGDGRTFSEIAAERQAPAAEVA